MSTNPEVRQFPLRLSGFQIARKTLLDASQPTQRDLYTPLIEAVEAADVAFRGVDTPMKERAARTFLAIKDVETLLPTLSHDMSNRVQSELDRARRSVNEAIERWGTPKIKTEAPIPAPESAPSETEGNTEAQPVRVAAEATAPVATHNVTRRGSLPPVGTKLTGKANGKTIEAEVTFTGIVVNGQTFHSKSAAALFASHALGSTTKAVNGNVFWSEVKGA